MEFLKDIAPSIPGIAANFIGAHQERQHEMGMANKNIDMQREFAQHGIRWKVEDAKRAGIHPLYALGAQSASFSPVSQGSGGMGEAWARSGQELSRAMRATSTEAEREMQAIQLAALKTDLEGKQIDNQLRLSQLHRMSQTGPPMPGSQNFIGGQGNSGLIAEKPLERTATRKGSPHAEPGAVPDVGFALTGGGAVVPVPSDNVKQKIEDNFFHEAAHFFRNNILPNFGVYHSSPPGDWHWSYTQQGWVPAKKRKYQTTLEDARKGNW